MKKLVTLTMLALLVTGCSLFQPATTDQPSESNEVAENQNSNTNANDSNSEALSEYTLDEIAMHDTAEDCWFAIEGKVYDVTAFIESGNHGGGDAILEGCGLDATELYNTRPMGSGTPHSERARGFLPNFEIGTLVE